LNSVEAFKAIEQWSLEASKQATSSGHPNVAALGHLLETASYFRRVKHTPRDYQGQKVVEFDISNPSKAGVLTRYMLPVHFAIIRLLELIPGITVFMADVTHETLNNARPESDKIFALKARCAPSLAQIFGLPRVSRLDRIMFSAPPDTKLFERRTGDYHYIIPANYVPLRYRGVDAQTAETWLKVVVTAVTRSKSAELSNAPLVLRQLFLTAERWHWGELQDRLPEDPRVDPI
jgi:hypothetical protein